MMKYAIQGMEEGHPLKGWTQRFKTLKEVQTYVKDRWEGPDYIDGPAEFHSDYVTFELLGCTLADLGQRRADDFYSWEWKEL